MWDWARFCQQLNQNIYLFIETYLYRVDIICSGVLLWPNLEVEIMLTFLIGK